MKAALCAAILLFTTCSPLKADTVHGFNVNGTFLTDDLQLSGTMSLDTTIGLVQTIDRFYSDQEFTYFDQGT